MLSKIVWAFKSSIKSVADRATWLSVHSQGSAGPGAKFLVDKYTRLCSIYA